jgi:hypothetical protein
MADALIFEFGADVTQFNASIGEVTKEIKKLKEALKSATGAEIPKLNAEISQLQTSLSNLKNVGTPAAAAFTKVEDSAKGARIALTNVSQIAQDLPFGFIGIQNNIPGLVQSFTKLSGESGGVVGALKAMGSALIGPAGIFLAFSAVTSIVTVVIQKYGSLGAALDALFGKTNLAIKAQEEYNKALAQGTSSSTTEAAEIKILVGVLTDLTQPLANRQAAYVELQKIRPDILAGQKLENISTKEAIRLIDENSRSVQKLVLLKAQEAAISNILNKNAEELAILKIAENKLREEEASADRDLFKAKKEGILVLGAGRTADQLAIIAKNNAAKALDKNLIEQEKLNKVAQQYVDLLDPTIKGIAAIDLRTKQLTDSLKEQEKVIKTPKAKAAKEKKGLDILDLERRARIAAQKLQEQADKNRLRFLAEQLKAEQKLTKEFEKKQESQTNADAKAFSKVNFKNLADGLNPILEVLKNLEIGTQRAATLIEQTFFSPLNDAFETLFTKGTFAIKDFTKALLNSIGQIAAKLAATAIVNGLISLFAAPFGGALSGAGSLGFLGNLIGGIGGRTGSANFGGVQGGGFGMSGSVNMVLRGTDLVGSINRTNSQISRVG